MKEFRTACEEEFKALDTVALLNKLQNCATAITNQVVDQNAGAEVINGPLQGILKEFQSAFVYLSFSSEAPTDKLVQRLEENGVRVYAPVLKNGEMFAVEHQEDFTLSDYGIREPVGDPFYGDCDVAIVPLLAAAYVWLDDDAEKAQYYMSLYRDGMASLKLYSPRCVSTEYEDVTGWAK